MTCRPSRHGSEHFIYFSVTRTNTQEAHCLSIFSTAYFHEYNTTCFWIRNATVQPNLHHWITMITSEHVMALILVITRRPLHNTHYMLSSRKHKLIVSCAIPDILQGMYIAKKSEKQQSTQNLTRELHFMWSNHGNSYHIFSPTKDAVCKFRMIVLISCYHYHLCSPLYGSCLLLSLLSLQFPQTRILMEQQVPVERGCPPTVDMLPLLGYTHEMTPSPANLAGIVSRNRARCVCQPGVKGHSSTND